MSGSFILQSLRPTCSSFHLNLTLFVLVVFFLFASSVTGFAARQLSIENAVFKSCNESAYGDYTLSASSFAYTSEWSPGYYFAPLYSNPGEKNPFDDPKPPISAVTKTALNDFKFLSGINRAVLKAQKTVNVYSRKFKLTGEFDFHRRHDPSSKSVEKDRISNQMTAHRQAAEVFFRTKSGMILSQFAVHKITWDTEFDLSRLSFKLGFCDALKFDACAGDDFRVGATVRVIF